MKLRKRIFGLEQEVKQLNLTLPTINEPSSPKTPTPSPSKVFLSSLSPAAKKRATLRMIGEKSSTCTILAVRVKFDNNLSNQYSPPSPTTSQVEEKIRDFMCRDDILLEGKSWNYYFIHYSNIMRCFKTSNRSLDSSSNFLSNCVFWFHIVFILEEKYDIKTRACLRLHSQSTNFLIDFSLSILNGSWSWHKLFRKVNT